MLKTIPHTGMAVSSDVGDSTNVHPRQKKEVGERLARLALNFTYQKNIVPYGPMPLNAQLQNNQIIISFQYAGTHLKTGDEKTLRGFVVRNAKGIDKEANAFINRNKVVMAIDKNEKPVKVSYGWKPYSDANLVNSEGLPASTFEIKIE